MPRTRKKARSSLDSDDTYAPPASARRPPIKVKPREQRERRAPAAFSPTANTPLLKTRKPKDSSPETDSNPRPATPVRPEHKRLENKIKSQAHRLRYPLAFIEAYEAEGWRKSSRDKLKPNKELEVEHRKIMKGQRALIDGLRELKALNANDPQVPPLAVFEEVHCSRCGSTDIEPDNDILLCDSIGCHRAYHQQCQTPFVLTANIPAGAEPWFCEVCLAVFECLKSINSVFGATYESVDDLFPELTQPEQQAITDASSTAQSGEESGSAPVDDEEEDDDEDFVCNDEEDDGDDEEEGDSDEKTPEAAGAGEEEMAEEVPESTQDLLYLRKDDVIDPNHRSMRSKSAAQPPKPTYKKPNLVGEPAAKIDHKTGEVILGVVADLEPPTKGRYSRWRIDYRDGSSELLTRSKTEAAINRAAVEDSGDEQSGDDSDSTLIVHGKRKRNDVDYRQLNELMFAGKDEDSENDETFEVKEGNEEEPDEEGENDDEGGEEDEGEDEDEKTEGVSDQSSPTTVTASQNEVNEMRSHRNRAPVNYLAMHEGMFS
ncbi:hypothetical protein KRP22_003746 [Phytophthora ramorum]|nr:Homeobox protein HAZ1 [Phytophthora ramorum]